MANSLDVLDRKAKDLFVGKAKEFRPEYADFVPTKVGEAGGAYWHPVMLTGFGTYTEQSGDGDTPSATSLTAMGTAYKSKAYEKRFVFSELDLMDNPELLNETAMGTLNRAMQTIDELVLGSFATLDAIVHPFNDDYTATGGGDSYMCDDHATPVAQVNVGTSALDGDSLEAARVALNNYKLPDGTFGMWGNDPLRLIVPPALQPVADGLVARTMPIGVGDSTGIVDPSNPRMNLKVVTSPFFADNNDWVLASVRQVGVRLWLRKAPYFRTQIAPGAGRIEVYTGFVAAAAFSHEGGLYMGKVA